MKKLEGLLMSLSCSMMGLDRSIVTSGKFSSQSFHGYYVLS